MGYKKTLAMNVSLVLGIVISLLEAIADRPALFDEPVLVSLASNRKESKCRWPDHKAIENPLIHGSHSNFTHRDTSLEPSFIKGPE